MLFLNDFRLDTRSLDTYAANTNTARYNSICLFEHLINTYNAITIVNINGMARLMPQSDMIYPWELSGVLWPTSTRYMYGHHIFDYCFHKSFRKCDYNKQIHIIIIHKNINKYIFKESFFFISQSFSFTHQKENVCQP